MTNKYKDLIKDSKFRKKFNIDLAEYNRLFKAQNGLCKICLVHQSSFKKALAVDHCHKTGLIRGLLCFNCNAGLLPTLEKNPEIIERAKKYLNGELINAFYSSELM